MVADVNTPLLDALTSYFGEDGRFHHCSFDTLSRLASQVYDRYMCNAAYDDAFGYSTPDQAAPAAADHRPNPEPASENVDLSNGKPITCFMKCPQLHGC